MNYKVGTRGSKLAVAQTKYVIHQLKSVYPEDTFEVVVIKTTGDKNQTKALDALDAKGVFVDTIEQALLNNEIQLAVHSMKDMPEEPLTDLTFAKAWKREDPRDVLILKESVSLFELKAGARIATGSRRRAYQIRSLRPDIEIVPIRGNVDTRIRKLHEGLPDGTAIDGIVLASAGLKRLGREEEISQYLTVSEMIPAPAQGTLALEVNKNNTELLDKINALSDEISENIVFLERGFLKAIGASCHDAVGAYASFENGKYVLTAMYGKGDDGTFAKAEKRSETADERLIEEAAEDIQKQLAVYSKEK